jgi:ribosomal protein S18 acetylase RimI-like enzyme
MEHAADPTLRRASARDIPALLEMQERYYGEDGYDFDSVAAREAWSALLEDERLGRVWVAELAGGERVAYLVLTLGFSLEYLGRDAFVDELYVMPAWRRRGLGRRALEIASAACAELDVRALHLEVERDKPGALALYRERGFQDRGRLLLTRRR